MTRSHIWGGINDPQATTVRTEMPSVLWKCPGLCSFPALELTRVFCYRNPSAQGPTCLRYPAIIDQDLSPTRILSTLVTGLQGFPAGSVVNRPPAMQEMQETWFDSWVGKIPWSRTQQPTPVLLPGESHGWGEPGGLQSIALQRVRHEWSDWAWTRRSLLLVEPLFQLSLPSLPYRERGFSPCTPFPSWIHSFTSSVSLGFH